MAGVSRKAVERYVKAAVEACKASEVLPVGPNDELDGALDRAHALALTAALDEVSRRLWHPWLMKLDDISGQLWYRREHVSLKSTADDQ